MPRRRLVALAILALITPSADAQTPQQAGDILAADAGSAVIRGLVVDDTGTPIANAEVMARASLPQARQRLVVTGADGRFEFRDLPHLSIGLGARKDGYASTLGHREVHRQVAIGPRPLQEGIELVLVRAGVITGRVVGPDGEPVVGARVAHMVMRRMPSGRGLGSTGNATTDDRGIFRAHSLPPGRYYVSVSPPHRGVPTRADSGLGLATTFHPGTIDAAEAVGIEVPSGGEVAVDITMQAAMMHTISGRVVDGDRTVAVRELLVFLKPRKSLLATEPGPPIVFDGDGGFLIAPVQDGDYTLVARLHSPAPASGRPPDAWAPVKAAEVDIRVGDDVHDVVLQLTPGATVRGRVVFHASAPDDLSGFRIQPQRVGASEIWRPDVPLEPDGTFEITGVRGRVALHVVGSPVSMGGPGGVIGGIVPATRPGGTAAAVAPARPVVWNSGWRTRALRLDGRVLPDQAVDVGQDGTVDGIEVEVARDYALVTGVVRNARGEPIDGAALVAIANDQATAGVSGELVRIRGTSQGEGRYTLPMLAPGTWSVLALSDLPWALRDDPDTLSERLRAAARRVTLGPGQRLELDLVVVTP